MESPGRRFVWVSGTEAADGISVSLASTTAKATIAANAATITSALITGDACKGAGLPVAAAGPMAPEDGPLLGFFRAFAAPVAFHDAQIFRVFSAFFWMLPAFFWV